MVSVCAPSTRNGSDSDSSLDGSLGNYIEMQTSLHHSLGSFIPSIDGIDYPAVNLSKNMAHLADDSSMLYNQTVWGTAGLGDGTHLLKLTNEDGLLMVDSWTFGTALQSGTVSSSTTSSSATTSATSTASASTFSASSGAGIWIAIGIALSAGLGETHSLPLFIRAQLT